MFIYIYIDIYHRSTPQANWPKIFEKLVARLPGCPPFTHLKGRQNRILGARPRLYATVVIANKKGRWFSKQCFGQMIICIIYIYIYESYIIQVFSLQNFEVLAAATSSASARRLPRLNLCQRVVNQLMFKHWWKKPDHGIFFDISQQNDQPQHLIARNQQKKAFRSGSARGRHLD